MANARLARAVLLALLMAATSACGILFPDPFAVGTGDRPLAKSDARSEWEPLEEVVPAEAPNGARLAIVELDENAEIGEEGYVAFARLAQPDGTVILDLRIRRDGGAVAPTVPAGDYELSGYYRTCAGNCGFLDPPEPICSTQVDLAADRQYLVAISVVDGCMVEEGSIGS
jgi:hypothetical protein